MPRRSLLLFAGAALVALGGLHAPSVSAQSNDGRGAESANVRAGEKVRLAYRGLSECPDAAAFRAAVARRLTGAWEASPGELARQIDIVVSRVDDGYVATIALLDAEGQRLRRAVRGRDCGDVVNGIALVTALAIESRIDEAVESSEPATASASAPTAASDSAPTAASDSAPPAAPSARGSNAPASPGTTEVPPASAPVVVAPALATGSGQPSEGSASEAASTPLAWRAGVRAGFASGMAPQLAPGVALTGMLERGAARFGLSLFGFSSGRVIESGVEARFDLLAARLEGCPLAFEVTGSLSLEPCVSFEAGVLSGRAYSDPPTVEKAQSGAAPWLAPGALARLVLSFGQVVVELEGAARFPLRREEFYVDSESESGDDTRTTVHEVPATSFGAALGVGLRF